jgi:hypothetical protein
VKLLLLAIVMVVVLFVAGLVAPRKSRRLQQRVSRLLRRGERKGDRKAGRFGDWTEDALRWIRKAGNRSAKAGRNLRRKLPGSSQH